MNSVGMASAMASSVPYRPAPQPPSSDPRHRRSGSSAKSKPTDHDGNVDHAFTAATPLLGQHEGSPSNSLSGKQLPPKPLPQPRLYAPPLRSQYPRENSENHVEYILVASFDIDRGSVMEHQYPAPISGDEHMLAELMLPDQTHMRSQDWTIFFLHKDTTAEDEAREKRKAKRKRRRKRREAQEAGIDPAQLSVEDGGISDGDDGVEISEDLESTDEEEIDDGPPLIYVLNLVNTKQDATVKRGAVVKAMAICTRHSFLHIYKPLLLLALEEYFRNPVLETLASLYNAVNSMDLSLMPRLTPLERNLLQSSDAKDMFAEKFQLMIQQRQAEDAQRLSSSSKDSAASLPRYVLPRDTHEFESRVSYNNVPVPIKVPVAITPETVGDFSLIKLITTFSDPHKSSPQPFTLHSHLTTSGAYTHPIIVLMNALLTQKRVIFLGHNQPSGSVAEAVLAACSLASGGILKGFTRHAFPYTDLTKIDDLLKVPGFIAGVTNPAFGLRTEWWDLLCDLPTGRMKISPKIEAPPLTEGTAFFQQGGHAGGSLANNNRSTSNSNLNGMMGVGSSSKNETDDPTGDKDFMESVMASIANRHGEAVLRSKFRNWVHRFTLLAATFEEIVYGASALHIGASETDADAYGFGVQGHGLVWSDDGSRMKEINAQVGRIEGWRQSRSYFSLVRDLARHWERGDGVRGIDLEYQIERLRIQKPGNEVAGDVFKALSKAIERAGLELDDTADSPATPLVVMTPADVKKAMKLEKARYDIILHLLSSLPESGGGLFYLSLGLFHKSAEVRAATVGLLERVMVHDAGRHYWASLGRFAKLAFFRVKREGEGGQIEGPGLAMMG